ncbi:MAG: hypothetical protein EOP88_06720 [Verrucomicrobiaceae bacterium]|nr:MAG: hypothetical protein EOP88_06720 [Verrucomicrobiaceae bacterium]
MEGEEDEKDVFCVSCGEAIVINLDMIGAVLECPACHIQMRLDEADENDSAENDIEWIPEVDGADATRVFGTSGQPTPVATLPIDGAVPTSEATALPVAVSRKAGSRFPLFSFMTFAATVALGWLFYQETLRTKLMEQRLESVEQEVLGLKHGRAASEDLLSQVSDLESYLEELDDTVSEIAGVLRLQNATSLQNEYSVQSNQKHLIRQQGEFGKLALKLALVEKTMADESRLTKEAFELSVRKRKEAELASKPIRQRIRDLEEQKNKLFAQYRAGSIPRYPQGVVSRGRAVQIMRDYEKRAAPLLAQIQEEIAKVRETIEAEEAKIEALYSETAEE